MPSSENAWGFSSISTAFFRNVSARASWPAQGEERAEREVRQERVGLDRDGLLERLERAVRPAGLVLEDAHVDEGFEVVRLAREDRVQEHRAARSVSPSLNAVSPR